MLMSLGNARLYVDADVYRCRSFLRHPVPVPTSDPDALLLDNLLIWLLAFCATLLCDTFVDVTTVDNRTFCEEKWWVQYYYSTQMK